MRTLTSTLVLVASLLVSNIVFAQKQKTIPPPKNYVFIPSGELANENGKDKIDAFFLSKYEVTNAEYRQFLNDLKVQGRVEDLKVAAIDSIQWKNSDEKNAPYTVHYHNHKVYNNYPIVNISHDAAILYCKWLTEKYNLEQKKKGLPYGEFRLPSKLEWIWAAKGGKDAIYPWGTPYLHDAKGAFYCCYRSIGDEMISFSKETNTYNIVMNDNLKAFDKVRISRSAPCPVESFNPQGYGLNNMSGNAAEFVIEPGIILGGSWNSTGYDVRIGVTSEYQNQTTPTPYVGFRPLFVYYGEEKKR